MCWRFVRHIRSPHVLNDTVFVIIYFFLIFFVDGSMRKTKGNGGTG